eukprot:15436175-Alexandrium_andersonii.AAC.1
MRGGAVCGPPCWGRLALRESTCAATPCRNLRGGARPLPLCSGGRHCRARSGRCGMQPLLRSGIARWAPCAWLPPGRGGRS